MKKLIYQFLLTSCCVHYCYSQQLINGIVKTAATGLPLHGATIYLKLSNSKAKTDANGHFIIPYRNTKDSLFVSYIGCQTYRVYIGALPTKPLTILLSAQEGMLEEAIVSTGYYQVPVERSTGSFTHIDENLFNRSVTPDVLSRLEGITNSLLADRRGLIGENAASPTWRIRGVSTIESATAPLIIVDNFPYEGDLNSLNPNDVSSVTVLRDAAAASIWGSRAGNGVIVITTKQGMYNQKPAITFNSNLTVGNKPDLFYNRNFLPSETVMNIERELYERGVYSVQAEQPIPAYVALLIQSENGQISQEDVLQREVDMKGTDSRSEALLALYQRHIHQQYAINIKGGENIYRYMIAGGLDNDQSIIKNNSGNRLNLNFQNSIRITSNLEFSAGIWYSSQKTKTNGLTYSQLTTTNIALPSPYYKLVGPGAESLPIVRDYNLLYVNQAADEGLLDWYFRPVDEINLADNRSNKSEMRITSGVSYTLPSGFALQVNYQFIHGSNNNLNYYDPETYYVRNLVNRFTQTNSTKVIPNLGILMADPSGTMQAHSGRIQLNYQHTFNEKHGLNILAGGEIRQQVQEIFPGYVVYNFDDNFYTGDATNNFAQTYPTRPSGSSRIPGPTITRNKLTDRYLSYFGNASYSLYGKYTLSSSIRWDASNIFGVKTNQRGIPLWSAGAAWDISKEKNYQMGWIPYARIRFTYGSSGNVNKSVSTYPTAYYDVDAANGLRSATLTSAGNPSLKWEKVYTLNAGLDLSLQHDVLKGSVEYYIKNARDLIGTAFMDPTTGIIDEAQPLIENKINYADLQTKGLDIQLSGKWNLGMLSLESIMLFNYVKNKITHYNTNSNTVIGNYLEDNPPPIEKRSVDLVYAIPWMGLNPQTGAQQVFLNGVLSDDYTAYYNSLKLEDLVAAGVTSPPYFGSLRQVISWHRLRFDINLSWKAGYVFKRQSMIPGGEYWGAYNYHMDMFDRWQKPGDEKKTTVPSYTRITAPYADAIYRDAEILITKGDHIRVQDISMSYSMVPELLKNLYIKNIDIYIYAKNLGLLGRANKNHLDPEYAFAAYPDPLEVSLGIRLNL